MCLNETRLDNHISDHELNIDNYSLVRKDRSRKGGGIALYVHESLAFNVCTDLNNDDLELIWCKINPKHQASLLIYVMNMLLLDVLELKLPANPGSLMI